MVLRWIFPLLFFVFATTSMAQPFFNWFGFGQEESTTPNSQKIVPQEVIPQGVELYEIEPQKVEPPKVEPPKIEHQKQEHQISAVSNNGSMENEFSSEFEDIGKHDIVDYDYDYGNSNYYQLHEDNSNEASKSK